MSAINFCHIMPVSYLPFTRQYSTHLLLAHLVEENEQYRNFYVNLKRENPNVFYHLDNSAFEMFKRGAPMYDSDKLIEMGKKVGADSIVMSDYPKQHWSKTVDSAVRLIPEFKKQGFKTFFCPQSELGDVDGLISSFQWAINNGDIDFIGVSILACPIALGVNEVKHGAESRDEAYRMQRYLSRWAIFDQLDKRGLLGSNTSKRFHCLGMTDGPREIALLSKYHQYIFSWDSSSAAWHAINGIDYDNSPTGLRHGKLESEVDFNIAATNSVDVIYRLKYNTSVIDSMCRENK
jgi:hypothetical protein